MKLLDEKELIWSAVVANCNMNRKRNLIGINSYEDDLGFDILGFIKDKKKEKNEFNWVDLCCGEANALIQADKILRETDNYDNLYLEGVDLVDMFSEYEKKGHLSFKVASLLNWNPDKKYDLITCVHGLHYLGDKLLALQKIMECLKKDGKFIGNIDFDNIRNENNKSFKSDIIKYIKEKRGYYNNKKKILIFDGYKELNFHYMYIGADEKAGKNYTGQEVINSIYTENQKYHEVKIQRIQ